MFMLLSLPHRILSYSVPPIKSHFNFIHKYNVAPLPALRNRFLYYAEIPKYYEQLITFTSIHKDFRFFGLFLLWFPIVLELIMQFHLNFQYNVQQIIWKIVKKLLTISHLLDKLSIMFSSDRLGLLYST